MHGEETKTPPFFTHDVNAKSFPGFTESKMGERGRERGRGREREREVY